MHYRDDGRNAHSIATPEKPEAGGRRPGLLVGGGSARPALLVALAVALVVSVATTAWAAPGSPLPLPGNNPVPLTVLPTPAIASSSDLEAISPCRGPLQAGTPVRPSSVYELRKNPVSAQGAMSWAVVGFPEITAMSDAVTRSMEANAVVFPGVSGPVSGFFPGRDYHELYIRDTASALLVAPYLYPDAFLRTTVEEFLSRQWTAPAAKQLRFGEPSLPGSGAIYGLIAPGGWADKSTATSDEEPSLIHSAYRYVSAVGGSAWLSCDIQGSTVAARLHAALDQLVIVRTDPATGLIMRAHTTDWGDIRMQGGDTPTHVDPSGEVWTVSIYDQAVAYLAMRQLAEIMRLAEDSSSSQLWSQRADALRIQTNRYLWQQGRGYYRTHLHVTPFEHGFDEDGMVSIANAVAVYAGLAGEAQTQRIFSALEATRLEAGVEKPGLAIYPPYPGGVFNHPNMGDWLYQNGAQWDWWGAVQITAEFITGHSELARTHLGSLARSWKANPGSIAEWEDPFGGPKQGTLDYTAAAGTAAEAVIRGLFGIELNHDGFIFRSRLGARDGFIQLSQPANGHAFWARQRMQAEALVIDYSVIAPSFAKLSPTRATPGDRMNGLEASQSGPGWFEALLPSDRTSAVALVDGVPRAVTTYQLAHDRYVVVGQVPAGTHRVEVTLQPPSVPEVSARWDVAAAPVAVQSGQTSGMPVTIANDGTTVWRRSGTAGLRLRARWLDPARQPQSGWDTVTVDLPQDVAPGRAVTLRPSLSPPNQAGDYWLRWELISSAGKPFAATEAPVRVRAVPFGQQWAAIAPDITVRTGRQVQLPLTVENAGFAEWQHEGLTAVAVGQRWYRSDGREVLFTGSDGRIALSRELKPGEIARLSAQVTAPVLPGRYTLRFDLVRGPGAWFSSMSSQPTAEIVVQVVP